MDSFKKYYLGIFKKYTLFTGRANRKEFWMFALYSFLIAVVISIIDYAANTNVLIYLYDLIILIPSIALIFRRLHDINKSGAWILIALIPIIGEIWLLVLLCKASTPDSNNYGELSE